MVGKELKGKVAVKLHSGEKGNQNFLGPDFWKPMVNYVEGTVVECNTAYVANEVPSVYLGIAVGRSEDESAYPLHHPEAKCLDECLAAGTVAYAHIAMELLNKLTNNF